MASRGRWGSDSMLLVRIVSLYGNVCALGRILRYLQVHSLAALEFARKPRESR